MPQTRTAQASRPFGLTYLALGDSVTWGQGVDTSQRYADLLKGKFSTDGHSMFCVNQGVSGYTLPNIADRIADWARVDADLITILAGYNDARTGVTTTASANALTTILNSLTSNQKAGRRKIFFCTIFQATGNLYPIADTQTAIDGVLNSFPTVTRLNTASVITDPLLQDNVHPTAAGHTALADYIYPLISGVPTVAVPSRPAQTRTAQSGR